MKNIKDYSFLFAVGMASAAIVLWVVDPESFYQLPERRPLLIGTVLVTLPFSNQFRLLCETVIELTEEMLRACARTISNL